jgi:hypothetical protein
MIPKGPILIALEDCGQMIPVVPLVIGNVVQPTSLTYQMPPSPLTLGQPDQGCG